MEFLVAIGVGIVSKLGEVLVDPITSQFKLMIHYDKNINKMKNELNNLEDRKRVIEGTVDADRRNGRHITPNVEHWLYQVDNIIENESWKVYDDELVNNNKNCLGGLCPNLVFRYSLSKKARKMTRDLVSLKEQKLEFISYPIPLPTLGSTFTEGIKSFASRESIMEEVIERLKGDEFHRISICGMGGVGKTTLVKELIKVLEADKVFDEISMAIVSQVPDYRKIQGQIGDTLGLKFDKETLQGRACQLLERLNKINKVFLVLDDVWTELDLELIGLPSNEQSHKGCKILFTSRNEDVCHRMRSQRNFTIPILSKEEAWDLFRYTAGDHVVDKAEMHNISKQVANECRGLPIAIVTIGKALGNKDKHVWEDALDQLRRSSLISFSEMQEYSIYSCIELSYNFLGNEEAKFLLLLCSLFPEDFDIPIEVLLRYGVGLGLFKDLGALFKARNRVHTLIDTLKKRFLLLDSNKEECVKMHDVVRDTVIIIASREEHGFAVKYDVGQEGLNDEFIWHHNAISLLLDEIKMHHKSLQCPNLRLLQVFIKRRESISENFFHNMSKLMVLGLSNLCIPSMSSLFQTLNNLCTLRLEDCQVGDISIICKELRKLEVLSFAYSNIKELPVEIGKLSLLRLLDLTECNNLDQISSGVLASLSYLEELYLRVWNSHWEGKNSILAELESLSHQLKVFEISITGIHIFPKDLEFKKLIKFWIYVRDSTTLYHGLVRRGYLYPNILKLNSVYYKDIKENVAIQQLLKKSEILNLVNVKQLENVLYELDEEGFPCLKNLSIEFCNDLKYLIDESVYASSCAFRLVQSLSLNNLDNLREVCHAKSFTSSSCQCFGSLRDLKVEFCNKLKYVFSPSLSLSIGLLQRLHVTECYEVKYIVSKEIHVENLVIKFTNLVELKLEELPSFVGFTISDHKNELHLLNSQASLMRDHISSDVKKVYSREEMRSYMPNLEQLQVKGWNSLDVIFQLEKNQHSNTSINCVVKLVPMLTSPTSITSFNNLILLSLEACPNLRYLFSHSIAKLLRNLQEVKLSNCRMVEQLVKSEDGSVMFSHASSLKAVEDALPSHATSISKESFVLEFPSLKRISIINCIMLKVIIKDGEWRTDMTSFNQVQSLTLSHLPNLVSFCYQPCIPEQPSLEKCKANNHYQQVQVTYDEKRMIRNDPSINYLWFSHLTYLGIKECQKINCLFSPSSSASLVCLQELEICNCENIKEIVSKQEIHEGFFKIMFPRLQRLKLEHLSNLEAFCHSSYDLDFPLLQEVCFGNCHRMEIFSNGFATTPKLNGITMKVGKLTNIIWMGDLNTTAQLSKGLLAFQTSERLEWLKQEQGMLSYFMKEIEMNVESFQSLLALVPSNVIHLFQNLKNLTIKDCGSLIEVFESEGVNKNKRQSMIHYELEVMNLHFLPKLIHIWKNHGGVLDFQKLRILKVEYCGNLKGILSPSMAKSLVQLQHFRVCNCQMIEEIVIKEAEENERESKAEILFPLLNKLELRYLPNLKSYCAESIDIELPFCEEMIIEKCPKMMTFSYGAVSTPKLPNIYKGSYEYVDIMGDLNMTIYQAHSEDLKVALQRSETINWIEQDKILLGYITRITELVFEGCEKLLNCVPSNMIHRLQHLKQLKVRECCSLVEIFESEGVEANEDEKHVVTLHEYNLQEMYLYSLPKIMHIWKNHGEVLSFRNLKKLNMGCCDGLRSVVPFSIAKTLLQLQELSIYECEMIER
ncbi:uncharacterized protein LOC129293242 isoform X3 [Prosopis cineraria]|uniref:uncharacterized protein LOC129293242 isoform X3 n=1 Tax=Prosopis cineraria TaxID=364024 RepID=UPI0024105CE6|nr:uncharacterized protein LOC129293242 isoform X3 [Prosopis cineraria]